MNEQQNHCCAATCTMLRCPDHLYSTKSIRNCDFENIIFTGPKSDLIATYKASRVTRKPLRGGESGKVRCESPKTFSKSPLQGRITARTVTTKTIVFVVTSRWNPLAVASFRIWLLGLFPPLWELSRKCHNVSQPPKQQSLKLSSRPSNPSSPGTVVPASPKSKISKIEKIEKIKNPKNIFSKCFSVVLNHFSHQLWTIQTCPEPQTNPQTDPTWSINSPRNPGSDTPCHHR